MSAPTTTTDMPLSELHEWSRNPRRISKPRLEALKRALVAEPEMLRARPLIALPDGTVVAGNQRLRAARELGWPSLPCAVVDLDEARAAEWALRDNRPYGEDDEALVGALLAELAADGRALDLTGYDSGEVDRLLAAARPAPVVDSDDAPPLPAEPRSVRGEVYELGPHRLMCGDACDEGDVAALLAGSEPRMMVTDPPYGVDYDPTWRETAARKGQLNYGAHRLGTVTNDDRADWAEAYALFPGAIAYVWRSSVFAGLVAVNLTGIDFELRAEIIWRKPYVVISRGHFNWQHEGCWYAVRKGCTAYWRGPKDASTVWEETPPNEPYGAHENREDTSTLHGTQKPIGLYQRPLALHEPGGLYDPFAGSGTAVIAAEQARTDCFAMEIEPAYCDVIRQRYADFTGQPELAP